MLALWKVLSLEVPPFSLLRSHWLFPPRLNVIFYLIIRFLRSKKLQILLAGILVMLRLDAVIMFNVQRGSLIVSTIWTGKLMNVSNTIRAIS